MPDVNREDYEEDRLKRLAERREQWPGPRELEGRFERGTMGHHEAFHVTKLIVDLIDTALLDHPAVQLDPHWFRLVREGQWTLYRAYVDAGTDPQDFPHLFPDPSTDERGGPGV